MQNVKLRESSSSANLLLDGSTVLIFELHHKETLNYGMQKRAKPAKLQLYVSL